MRRTLAYVKKFICRLRQMIKRINSSNNADQKYPCVLNDADKQDAKTIIIKLHQIALISLVPNQKLKGHFLKYLKTKYHISYRMVEVIRLHGRKVQPSRSHMSLGPPINSARVILSTLLKQHGTSSKDESLITLLSGVESIVNSRRLTVETLSVIVIFKMKLHSVQSILSS